MASSSSIPVACPSSSAAVMAPSPIPVTYPSSAIIVEAPSSIPVACLSSVAAAAAIEATAAAGAAAAIEATAAAETSHRRSHLPPLLHKTSARPTVAKPSAAPLPAHAQEGSAISSAAQWKSHEMKNAPPAKRLRSPIIPIVGFPGIRMLMSSPSAARVTRSPSTTLPMSPSEQTTFLEDGTARRSKKRKLTSKIWNDFEPIYDGTLVVAAKCIHCNKLFKAGRDVGRSTCRRHLASCDGKARLDQMVGVLESSTHSHVAALKDWKFDQEFSREELVKLIVVHMLPFSFVEYPRFKSFVASLNPCFKLISRTTIKGDCISAYEQRKLCLQEFLSNSTSRVSLTADIWTSNQTLGYLCITCHFIDSKWKLHKRIIRFSLVETPHDHKNMFNAMLKALHEWQIEDKLFGVSLDNATVNDTFINLLRDNLVEKHLLPCRGDFFHNHCATHVLNLIVQEGFKVVAAAISRIRESVKYVKCSQARKQRFEEMIKQAGIPSMKRPKLDVSTRWNSTYDMLISALMYRRAFRALTREDNQYVFEPVLAEWKMADKLCSILKVFYRATKKVSRSKYPTANLYFHQLWQVQKVLERESFNTTPTISSMMHNMKEKLRKYWNLSYLQICIPVIFDPRFKLKFLEFRLSNGFGNIAPGYLTVVRTKIRELFAEYSSHMNSSAQNDQTSENVEF